MSLYKVTTTFALLRKNADFRAVETSIHTLRTLFKQANIFPQEEPLSQTIQRILDSTDADEILLAHIQELIKFNCFALTKNIL